MLKGFFTRVGKSGRTGRAFGLSASNERVGPVAFLQSQSSEPHLPSAAVVPNVPALRVTGLCKAFQRPAVHRLDLNVRQGEFYASLAPNGAGKTTTLRIVSGLLRPDSGAVSIFGIDASTDPVAAKRITAWVSDEPMIYDKLSPM